MSRFKPSLRSVLSIGVVSAVLLCHVLGGLCVMAPSAATAAEMALVPAASHEVAMGGHDCGQYVPSCVDRLDASRSMVGAGLPPVDPAASAPSRAAADPSSSPRTTGRPLFAYLSTFRI